MAIKNKLTKETKENYYGFDFKETYFKIENIKVDIERNKIDIHVRGYASPEARDIEKQWENRRQQIKEKREKIQILSSKRKELTSKKDEKEIEKLNKKIDKLHEEKDKLTEEENNSSRVIGIYKEIIKCSLDDLTIKSFTKDGLKTAAYNYLKENIDLFKGEDI
jgi:hypothetical protein